MREDCDTSWPGRGMMRGLMAVVMACVLGACATHESPEKRRVHAEKLAAALCALDRSVAKTDAEHLAATAVEQSAALALEYRPVFRSWLNNILVNSGVRSRGLCWHWRDELIPHLFKLRLKTLELHLATARHGTPMEHNAVVVTARGRPFSKGMLLDPWPGGGVLSWKPVVKDRRPWVPLPPELTPDSLRPLFRSR